MVNQPTVPLSVLIDFDGTVTTEDIADRIMEEFATDGWHAGIEAYRRGEMSLREVWSFEISHLLYEQQPAMAARASEIAVVRPGFAEFIRRCKDSGVYVEIASSGITFLIDAVLEKCGAPSIEVAAPGAGEGDGGRSIVTFDEGLLDCGMTAMCKCERAWRQRRAGRAVLLIGDGESDKCVASQADIVLARDALATHCTQQGIEFTPFKDFHQAREFVDRLTGNDPGNPA